MLCRGVVDPVHCTNKCMCVSMLSLRAINTQNQIGHRPIYDARTSQNENEIILSLAPPNHYAATTTTMTRKEIYSKRIKCWITITRDRYTHAHIRPIQVDIMNDGNDGKETIMNCIRVPSLLFAVWWRSLCIERGWAGIYSIFGRQQSCNSAIQPSNHPSIIFGYAEKSHSVRTVLRYYYMRCA